MIGANDRSRKFKVRVDEVLEALRKNREEHSEIVAEAQEVFRERHLKALERMLKDAREGVRREMHVRLQVPTSHLNAYDNAILVLEMTKRAGEENIELTSDEIERFVRNRWEWMHQFATSNSSYSDKAKKYLDDAEGDF